MSLKYKLVKEINIYKSSAISIYLIYLSSKILKPALLALVHQLTYLFNLCLSYGVFPDNWKISTVIPLQKDGDRSDGGNLRPISLLPLPGKLLEKIIHTKMMTYLTGNNLLSDQQGGFRSGYSTIKCIADLTDELYMAMNNKEITVAVFIDFKKAFGTVDHSILLRKIDLCGIRHVNLKLLTSYLSNRKNKPI